VDWDIKSTRVTLVSASANAAANGAGILVIAAGSGTEMELGKQVTLPAGALEFRLETKP
jgi:hypothetical protein